MAVAPSATASVALQRPAPCTTSFALAPGGPRYALTHLADPADRSPLRGRRLTDRVLCPFAACVPAATCAAPAAGPRKRKAKDGDLVRNVPKPAKDPAAQPTHRLVVGPCVAVVLADAVHVYDLQRRGPVPVDTLECGVAVTALAFNEATACGDALELLVGFASGDVAVWNPLARALTFRTNKDKALEASGVLSLQWVPQAPSLFVAAFASGATLVFDTRFTDDVALKDQELVAAKARSNPVQRMPTAAPVTAVVFSPSGRCVALPAQDGTCTVVQWDTRKVVLQTRSYYGAVLAAVWSPDERYLAAGGEDDAVTLFDLHTAAVVARCVGHRSWVAAVQFAPLPPDDDLEEEAAGPAVAQQGLRRYRLVSAGHDTCVLFWDFDAPGAPPACTVAPAGATVRVPHRVPATLDPLATHRLHADSLCGLRLLADGVLVTACASAIVKAWAPEPAAAPEPPPGTVIEV